MRHLIYFVAIDGKHAELAGYAINSLYQTGYQGDCHLVTDRPVSTQHAPADKLSVTRVASCGVWQAKQYKTTHILGQDVSGYDAILYLDCDVLINADITPLLERAAANPQSVYAADTSGKRLLAVRRLADNLTEAEKATVPFLQPMVDSYAIAFAPTAANLKLLSGWQATNESNEGEAIRSDAMTLNLTLVRTKRLADVVLMPECERLRGQPRSSTVVEHYVYGQSARMPYIYKARFSDYKPKSKVKFVVMTQPRSGSHMLQTALAQHSRLKVLGELYHPKINQPNALAHANGCLIHDDQISDEQVAELAAIDGLRIVWLSRADKLAQYVSNVYASRSKRWQAYTPNERLEQEPLAIDTERMTKWLKRMQTLRAKHLEALAHKPSISVTYEELVSNFDDTLAGVQSFLGVEHEFLSPATVKQSSKPVDEQVTNGKEARKAIVKLKGGK